MTVRFRDLLSRGEVARVFVVGRIIDPVVIDMFALAGGFHGFWIDQEHVGLTWRDIQLASQAARANGLDCFVRMAPTDYSMVTQNLEAGAGGIMFARIESADHAEQCVQWTRFAPRGNRGMNTSGRDARYTHLGPVEFAESANREHFLAIQIETLGALEECERIAANDAVDLLFVGPTDLSQALGITGQWTHPKLWEALGQVAAACRRHGKPWGMVVPDPAFADRAYDLGCRMLSLGGDVRALRLGVQALKDAFKSRF